MAYPNTEMSLKEDDSLLRLLALLRLLRELAVALLLAVLAEANDTDDPLLAEAAERLDVDIELGLTLLPLLDDPVLSVTADTDLDVESVDRLLAVLLLWELPLALLAVTTDHVETVVQLLALLAVVIVLAVWMLAVARELALEPEGDADDPLDDSVWKLRDDPEEPVLQVSVVLCELGVLADTTEAVSDELLSLALLAVTADHVLRLAVLALLVWLLADEPLLPVSDADDAVLSVRPETVAVLTVLPLLADATVRLLRLLPLLPLLGLAVDAELALTPLRLSDELLLVDLALAVGVLAVDSVLAVWNDMADHVDTDDRLLALLVLGVLALLVLTLDAETELALLVLTLDAETELALLAVWLERLALLAVEADTDDVLAELVDMLPSRV